MREEKNWKQLPRYQIGIIGREQHVVEEITDLVVTGREAKPVSHFGDWDNVIVKGPHSNLYIIGLCEPGGPESK